RKGQYPYGEGQVWADPDVSHAAELMQKFVTNLPRHRRIPKDAWSEFSAAIVGNRYKDRLKSLLL
ncbi:MAG: glycosyl transferase family 1, partial [Pseudomonadota bacterium]